MLMMRHYDPEVCSEAALLLNLSNFSLNRVKSQLTSSNSRLRATTLESLWNRRDPEVLALLQEASKDPDERVRITALIGLARSGDGESARRLKELGRTGGPVFQALAAWATGELGDTAYAAELHRLSPAEQPENKALAERRIHKLRVRPSRPQPPSPPVR
jgi:HEAT repeat protein